ncbi:hypothetical protein RFI_10905 [Reticulomyxa filosa]|uniref:Uncharacterized protein n=1 Tax=Reticulomyxa filosa TaxID=46433 RepID=X6NIS4_RETFI|nr:hypothetical protein RFI_10905 [Reticulomyxa filosa]|eukprot:ETO26230.1 hypothetical protein RFI_10905 [Reticulomyxa filosa]
MFGVYHHYVAIAYNLIGNIYNYNKREYDKAIEFYEHALQIILNIFGNNCNITAQIYENLGYAYDKKGLYDKAIESCEHSLQIRNAIFENVNKDIAKSLWNLGRMFEKIKNNNIACKYFKEAWKTYSIVSGEWNSKTLIAKKRLEKF